MASKERDVYDICKFDGNNFALWKEQMQDVLVQKKQRLPIMQATRTENLGMTQIEWDKLDALARSRIRLHPCRICLLYGLGVCDSLCDMAQVNQHL